MQKETVDILPLSVAAQMQEQDVSNKIESGIPCIDDSIGGGFREGDFTIISGVPGNGKCLARGTKVLMFDGTIRDVETIKVGEKLMGPDSKARRVLALGQGVDELYEIRQNRGDNYTVNGDHILVLKKSGTEITKEITVNEALAKGLSIRWKGFAVPVEYKEHPVKIDPYFLGVWLGDGNSRDVRITTADQEIEDWIREYAKSIGLVVKKTPQPSRAYTLAVTKEKKGAGFSLQKDLREANLIENKHIPHEYIANSRHVRLELLAGLIDTDGYVNHEGYTFVNKSERLAIGFKQVAESVGLRVSMTKFRNKKYQTDYYKIGLSGDCSVIPVRIERKKVAVRRQIKNALNTGIEIVPVGIGGYYGFQIDGDGRFLLGDHTVTHNTTLARMFTTAFSEKGIPSIWFSYEMTITELWDSFEVMGADASLISYVPIVMEHEYDWILEHIDKARKEFGVKAIFIDTIRDVVKPQKANENYSLYVEQLCKDLRDYAIKNKMMIFAIAHATKQTRSNTEETSNADIAYSNGIPATATNIFHVWRGKKKDEGTTYVKIGKSRRDGTKKDWKFQFKFWQNQLIPVDNERYESLEDEF